MVQRKSLLSAQDLDGIHLLLPLQARMLQIWIGLGQRSAAKYKEGEATNPDSGADLCEGRDCPT